MPKPEPYRNEPMTRERAYHCAIAFGLAYCFPCQPRPAGDGFDAIVPMEVLERNLVRYGHLAPRPPEPPPRKLAVWKDPK